ncbi:hypothetical protein J7T55_009304 [Diaporthe amygdali]|uniref:uncharacterized protein n=1 Tax=Phomopsis amygdali TaxID=1214568 RepID=UPI0022FF25AB|nr:uncharacterized protein J7T55_009304 [Diaporthe amygdali]KAJ0118521.1 hypothetical protein J7T55_009304 [Diaporthe amygdali]
MSTSAKERKSPQSLYIHDQPAYKVRNNYEYVKINRSIVLGVMVGGWWFRGTWFNTSPRLLAPRLLITSVAELTSVPDAFPSINGSHNSISAPNKMSAPDKTSTLDNMSSTKRLPLPRLRGPKLQPFRGTASADIEFIEFIGNDEDMDSKVWKVHIDGSVYALKIDYIDYLDPFNCECRVYGRLKEENREELAIRAHGYVLLSKDQERRVTEGLGEDFIDWEKHPEPLSCDGLFWRWEVHRHEPLRAIVKDYVEASTPWIASQIPQMYADLEELHKLDRANVHGVRKHRMVEPYKFERMVDDWAHWNEVVIEKSEALVRWHSKKEEDFGFDPRLYDWQKWEEAEK